MSASHSDTVDARRSSGGLSNAVAASQTASSIRRIRQWCFDGGLVSAVAASMTAYYVRMGRRWMDNSVIYGAVLSMLMWFEGTLERWITHSFGYTWLTADSDQNVIVIDLRETKTIGPVLRILERILVVAIPAVLRSSTWRLSIAVTRRLRSEPLRLVGGGIVLVAFVSVLWSLVAESISSLRVVICFGLAIVGLVLLRDRRSWAQLQETRLVNVFAAIFVPPEPPAETSSREESVNEAD